MTTELRRVPAPVPEPGPDNASAPAWYDEFTCGLSNRSHFVVSGNLRDLYPAPVARGAPFVPFIEVLWQLLRRRGFVAILVLDPVDGVRLHPGGNPSVERILARHDIALGPLAQAPGALRQLHQRIATLGLLPVALVIENASRLRDRDPNDLTDLLMSADRVARGPAPARPAVLADAPPRNLTVWLVDRAVDLPDWFVVRNDTLREIVVAWPSLEDRFAFARVQADGFATDAAMSGADRTRYLEQFALECEGETLGAMAAIAELARREGIGLARVSDAIRSYRTGSRRNPWKSPVLRSRMLRARDILTARVKGQGRAVDRTLDILLRSITGLSGAQTGSRHARPRGTMFLVGPTGVGKTELAKAVTELLFGDDGACHRFDMSEFMDEGSVARLIGAPPGQPGHDRGGELINALHKRPFGVFLFDEIEKAHPRILDMFLQILDEGRLTDARGTTAHFSEALIVFTSNIGMLGGSRETNMGMTVMPSDPYDQIERKITRAVHDHFRFDLKRPELMNRIGQNVVVFDFIDHASASVIFAAIVDRVVATVAAEHGLRLSFAPDAYDDLRVLCSHDVFDGGRGIGNRIETHLINPLGHEIFRRGPAATDLVVTGVHEADGRTTLTFD